VTHRDPPGDTALVRALGTWGLAAAIVNVTIGGGIFRLPSLAAAALGAAAPLAYIVCAVAMMLIVLCFAEAGSRVSLTGGPYAYVEVAFGPLAGFLTGTLLWAGLTAAVAAVSNFLADSLGALVPALATPISRSLTIVIMLGALAALNVRGVRGAVRFNTTITIAKLLPLAVLVIGGAFAIRSANLRIGEIPAPAQITRASIMLIFAFLGVESALVPSGEVRDPARTVPRALFTAIGGIAVLYIAIQLVTQGILGPALVDQKTPLAEAARVSLGAWGRVLVLVGSSLAMFGNVSLMTLAVPRMLYAMARDGFLPSRLAEVHPRYRTPHWAIVFQTTLATAIALTMTFEQLAIVGSGTVLLVYVGCCLAAIELRRRDVRGEGTVPFRVPGARVVPWLALGVIVALLSTLRFREWMAVLATLVVALPIYALARARRAGTAATANVGD
jgi:amino acid transporter